MLEAPTSFTSFYYIEIDPWDDNVAGSLYGTPVPKAEKRYTQMLGASTYAVKHVPFRVVPVHLSLGNRTTWKMGRTERKKKMLVNFFELARKHRYTFSISFYSIVSCIGSGN